MGRVPTAGVLYCLASAAGFGAMGIFGKLAYDEGATVGTLLSTRFVVAAAVLWLFLLCSRRTRELRTLSRRDAGMCLALGAIGYGAQAGAYFAALDRLDASLLSLLLYTYPAMVTVAAIALGRERASRRKAAALILGSAGLVLAAGGSRGRPGHGGRGARAHGRARVLHLHPDLGGGGRPGRAARHEHARVHRRGHDAHTRRLRGWRSGPGGRERHRLRLARRACHVVHGRGHRPVLRRAAAGGPHGRGDPVDARAGGHGRAGLRRLRRIARSRAAGRGGLVLLAVLALRAPARSTLTRRSAEAVA